MDSKELTHTEELCAKMLLHAAYSEKTADTKFSKVKENLALFFEEEVIEKAIAFNCGMLDLNKSQEPIMEPSNCEIVYLRNGIDCAVNALTDSILCSGNDVSTNMHFVRQLKNLIRPNEPV